MRIVSSFIAVIGVVMAASGCGRQEGMKAITADPGDWRYERLVSLEMKDTPLSKVAEEISRQSGRTVKVYPFQEDLEVISDRRITLVLKDAPFWKAVAEASCAADVGFMVRYGGAAFTPDEAVLQEYRVVGPVLIGLVKGVDESEKTEASGSQTKEVAEGAEKQVKTFRVRIIGLGEACHDLKEPEIVLTDGEGKALGEPLAAEAGEMGIDEGELVYSVPDALGDRAVGVRGGFRARLVQDPTDVVVPLSENQEVEHAGLRASITRLAQVGDRVEVDYLVTWANGLKGSDAEYWQKILEEEVGLEEAWAWAGRMSDKLVAYDLMGVRIVDDKGEEVSLLSQTSLSRSDLSGSCSFSEKEGTGLSLRLSVGRVQFGEVKFAFEKGLE